MRFVLLSSNFHRILLNCQLWAKHQFWWLLCILWQLLWAVCYLKLTGVINLPSLSHHISQPPLTRRGRRAAAKQIWIRDRLLLLPASVWWVCRVSLKSVELITRKGPAPTLQFKWDQTSLYFRPYSSTIHQTKTVQEDRSLNAFDQLHTDLHQNK